MLIPTPLEEEQQPQLTLFQPDTNPAVVPRNPQELAFQLGLIDEDQETPLISRVQKRALDINAEGSQTLVADIAMKERQDQVEALKVFADARAKAGDTFSLERAARMIAAAHTKMAEPVGSVEGHEAVANRALEQLAADYLARRVTNVDALGDTLAAEGSHLALRNMLHQKIAELGEHTDFGDQVGHFVSQLVPFFDTGSTMSKLHAASGQMTVQGFRDFWTKLNPDERRATMKQLLQSSDNPARTAELLRKIADATASDALVDVTFDALSAFDVAAIAKGVGMVMRRGAPLVTVERAAGSEAAAQIAVADLMRPEAAKIGGLNDADLMARFLSIGKNPMDADPAAFAGMSAAGQQELRQAWDTLLEQSRNRLISSGLTPDEVKQGLAEIRANYSVETNKAIHSVIFGEGSELGQDMRVFWQGPDGKAFSSKEAAEAWAKAEGKVNYQVVPRNTANEPELASATELAAPKGASSGNVLDAPPERVASVLDRMAMAQDGDPMALQILDEWKAASAKGRSGLNGERVLRIIADQSSDPEYRLLASHLLSTSGKGVEWNRVGIELHYDLVGAHGTYNLSNNRVRVGLQSANDPDTLLHELIHAHNANVITLVSGSPKLAAKALSKEQIAAAKEVIELHKRLKVWWAKAVSKEAEKYGSMLEDLGEVAVNNKLMWALEHPAELITHGLVSTRVREALQKIKLSDLGYVGNDASVWSKLWDTFKAVLGYRASDTALAKLVSSQDRLAGVIDGRAQVAIKEMANMGDITNKDIVAIMGAGREGAFAARKAKPKPILKALEKEASKLEKQLANGDESVRDRLNQIREQVASLKPKAVAPAPVEEWLVEEARVDPISFANVGKFSDEDIRSMPFIAVDPKHGASELAIEERVIGVHAEAKTRRDLMRHLEPFFNKLDGKGKARVKAILEEGDAYSNGGEIGKEFTYAELRSRGLSEDEAQAYFAARQVRMVSYHLRNGEMVRSLRAEGFKEVELLNHLPDGASIKVAGRVFEESEAGAPSLGKTVYDSVTGEPVFMDSDKLAAAYREGKRLVQYKSPVQVGKKHFSMMLVDESTAKARDINAALHYRPGEFSRIYTDQYFITVKKMQDVDGVVQEVTETVRTAASQREAAEYVMAHSKAIQLLQAASGSVPRNIDQQLDAIIGRYTNVEDFKQAFQAGELDGFASMDWHYTRNKDEYLNSSLSEAATNGRLFTSKRQQKLFSVDADRRNTLDVYESLEAEITNIGRVANISMWRETMIRRWMNTFGEMLPSRTGNDVADFYAAAGATFTRGTKEAQFASRTHKYIMRQLGIRTQEERFYEGITRQLTEKLFTGNEGVEAVGAAVRQKGWLGFVRNWNFNFNLGMWNPAQLIVQANGAATAVILSPIHGAKAAMTFPLLRMALASDNPEVWRKLARMEKFKNLGLSDEGEFISLVKAIRKAGILDNLRSTALWNAEEGALNIFSGYPRRAAKSHTFFFNRGEEFSRVVSFDVARREWMAKNPGKAWNDDVALKQIVVRMDDLTQNMTKANLARWQEGIMSIPLQFAQYNIKLAANVMSSAVHPGRGFTRAEAVQLLLGHVLLYGAAGNGLMWILEETMPEEMKESLPVGVKEAMAQGLLTWVFDQAHEFMTGEGAKVALGSRLGSFDYWQRIGEAIYNDPKDIYTALLGPTMSTVKRIGVVGEVASLWYKDPDLTGQEVLEGLVHMGSEQVATLRNAAKAYLYLQHQGKMLDRSGVALGELNKNEMLWQALGFSPTMTFDVHNLIKSKQAHGEALDDIAKSILRTQRDIMTALNNGNTKKADELRKLLVALWPDNAGDLREVQRRIRDRLFPYDNEMQKLLGDYMWKGQTYKQPLVVTQEPKKR